MKQIIRAIAFIAALLPALAAAQQFPTVPNNTVIGRLGQGTGSGPSQAIPIATLSQQFHIPFVVPATYGAVCDGVTDDKVALQTAINTAASIKNTLIIPSGTTCYTSATLTVPSNSSIVGQDRDSSIIKGSTTPVFLTTNTSNVLWTNFTVQGTNSVTSWNSGTTGAIQMLQNSSAVAASSNWTVRGMRFKDFNNAYWAYWGSQTSTFPVNDPVFEDNIVSTTASNVPSDANPLFNNNYGLAMFSATGGNGQFVRPRIKNNRMDAGALCFPIILFGNHTGAEITGNQISNPGRTTPAHCVNGFGTSWNTYGIAIYDLNADGHPATNWIVANNVIKSPYATGIYIVGNADAGQISNLAYNDCRGCVIANNVISDQAQQDANPRGGIVVASTANITVADNELYNGYGGLVISGQTVGSILVQGNRCTTAVASSFGIAPTCLYLSAGLGTTNQASQIIRNNYLEATGTGSQTITTTSAAIAQFANVEISGNTINAGVQGLVYVSGYTSGSFVVNNNKFGGGPSGYMAALTNNSGIPVTIMNNVFDSTAGVTGSGLVVTGATINMVGNKFQNRTAGSVAMFAGVGATGTIQGTQFNNVVTAAQVAATSIGLAIPNWSASAQDYVQNLNVAAGSLTAGWINPTNGNNWVVVSNLGALGTGVFTALGVNVGSAGAFVVNGGALGTPSSGVGTNLTALNASNLGSGTVPAARTNGHQNGTATNDSGAAGEIGEYVTSTVLVGSAVSLTASTAANVTSISLTAGDWDVWGNVSFNPAGTTTITALIAWISTTSAALPTIPNNGAYTSLQLSWPTGTTQTIPSGSTRLSLSGTTTVYLSTYSVFATSTMGAYGYIGARRRR